MSLSCTALKILLRSRRTSSSQRRQSTRSQASPSKAGNTGQGSSGPFTEAHLRAVLIEYQTHDNTARPHQGIAQRVPGYEREVPSVTAVNLDVQRIRRKSIPSGLINEYSRAA
jgi:hypothetical protein